MKTSNFLAIASLGLLLLSGCNERSVQGNGVRKEETRQLGPGSFQKIEIDAPLDAHITIGGPATLVLKGDANVLPYVRSDIRNNTLHIYTDEHTDLNLRRNISAEISLPSLIDLDVAGAGTYDVTGSINGDAFGLELSGAAKVTLSELRVESFSAGISGAADLNMRSGLIGHGRYEVSGAGNIRAFGVAHQAARIDLSGASDLDLTVNESLEVEISGAGTVRYKGHPSITKDISGVGEVVDAN